MKFRFNYDKEADVLYASIGRPRPSIIEESEDGILIRKDCQTGRPIGFVIINYSRQKRDGFIKDIPYFPGINIPY